MNVVRFAGPQKFEPLAVNSGCLEKEGHFSLFSEVWRIDINRARLALRVVT